MLQNATTSTYQLQISTGSLKNCFVALVNINETTIFVRGPTSGYYYFIISDLDQGCIHYKAYWQLLMKQCSL